MDQVAYDLAHALRLMQAALRMLDETNTAHDVAAHLDLAICRLSELVGVQSTSDSLGNRNGETH